MARYDFDFDRDYGASPRRFGRRRSEGFRTGIGGERLGSRRDLGYSREFTTREQGYGEEFRGGREDLGYSTGLGYGREFIGRTGGYRGYGSEYMGGYGADFEKSQWQTDYGDPFGDRERGTPFRAIPGEFRSYGREYGRGDYYGRSGYGRDFESGMRRRRWR